MASLLTWLVDLFRRMFKRSAEIPAREDASPTPEVFDPDPSLLNPAEPTWDHRDDEEDVSDPPTVLYDGSKRPLTDEEPTFTEAPTATPPGGYVMSKPTLSRGAGIGAYAHLRDAVREAQTLMNNHGETLSVDGQFGPGTESAVKRVQAVFGLVATGEVGSKTWEAISKPRVYLHMRDDLKRTLMTPSETVSGLGDWRAQAVIRSWNSFGGLLHALASELHIAPSAACAVLAIESAGQGFKNGRQIIRFENHVFGRHKTISNKVFNDHFLYDKSKVWRGHRWRRDASDLAWIDQHTTKAGQNGEWEVLEFAMSLDRSAALMSISMGSPQIMGFNHKLIGYSTVEDMFDAFNSGDRTHVLGLFDFIMSDSKMPDALRSKNWSAFAALYNGAGKADEYGLHIKKGVEAAKALGIP